MKFRLPRLWVLRARSRGWTSKLWTTISSTIASLDQTAVKVSISIHLVTQAFFWLHLDKSTMLNEPNDTGVEAECGLFNVGDTGVNVSEVASFFSPETGIKRGITFDSRLPLLLFNLEAFNDDGRNKDNEKNAWTLFLIQRRLTSSHGNFIPCPFSESTHDETSEWSLTHFDRDDSGNLDYDSILNVVNESNEKNENKKNDNDDENDEGDENSQFAKRRKLSTSLRTGLPLKRLRTRRLQRRHRFSSLTASIDESDWSSIASSKSQNERTSSLKSGRHVETTSFADFFFHTDEATSIATLITDTDWQEMPIRGMLKRKKIDSKEFYTLNFSLQHLQCQLFSSMSAVTSRRSDFDMKILAVVMNTFSILKHVRMLEQASQSQERRPRFTSEENAQLVDLKQNRNFSWKQIKRFFSERSIETLQVHYCTKLKITSIARKKRRLWRIVDNKHVSRFLVKLRMKMM